MAKRPFTYVADLARVSVETAPNDNGYKAYIEYTSPNYVNLGFGGMVANSGDSTGWVSIHRGAMLDDLITALIYFRDEGEAIFNAKE